MSCQWPETDQAIARDAWAAGESATMIADRRLAGRYTRNAVMGFVHRWMKDVPGRVPVAPAKAAPVSLSKPGLVTHPPAPPVAPAPAPAPAKTLSRRRPRKPVPLLAVAENGCRWIVATGPALFCGAVAVAKYPYCLTHCRLAYPHAKEFAA